jgi:hypothetical protein
VLRARGELPPGHAGDAELQEMCESAERFAKLVRQQINESADQPHEVQLTLDQFVLTARFDQLHNGRLVRYRLTTRKPKDLLATWIDHLIANSETATESVLITVDKDGEPVLEKFLPIEKEQAIRAACAISSHTTGADCASRCRFFRGHRSDLSSKCSSRRGRNRRSKLRGRNGKHPPKRGNPTGASDPRSEDAYFRLAFRHIADPLDEEWEKLALAFFVPPVESRPHMKTADEFDLCERQSAKARC